jgi:hypothetical protein
MMKLPTGAIRRRNQPKGPTWVAPVATNTCLASITPRVQLTRWDPPDKLSIALTVADSYIEAPLRAAASAKPTPNLPMCI